MVLNLRDIDFIHPITPSITISPLRLQDDKNLYQHICQENSDLASWCPWMENLKTLKDVQVFLKEYKQQLSSNDCLRLALYQKGRLIGWVSAFNFNWIKGCYEIGYWIVFNHRRKGYILYTVRFMICLLALLFDLKTIYISCKKENNPSRQLAHRLDGKPVNALINSALVLYEIIV